MQGSGSPDKVKEFIKSCRDSFEFFAKKCLKIRDHNTAQVKPFVFNRPQRILHAIIEKQIAALGYVRVLLLKARRFGGSTYIEGRGYWRTSLWKNRNAFIIGHEEESTNTLFAMAQLYHEKNPVPPQTLRSNAKELVFDNENGTGLKGQYRLATAKNLTAGRSQGIHFLHDSEEAYWPNADVLLPSLMACIPIPVRGGIVTEVYRESTANGFGNTFQRDVFDAYCSGLYPYYAENGTTYAWRNPKRDEVLVFIPWFVHDIYVMAFDTEQQKAEFERSINVKVFDKERAVWEDSEAMKLKKKFSLSLEQLHWRKWAIEDICKGRVEIFRQEYPSNIEEAFLTVGSNVYSKELCDDVEKGCVEPVLIGDMIDRNGKPFVRPNPHGAFRIWEKPEEGQKYFMTVDSAGGIKPSQEREQREPDPSCIDVWNHLTGKQVAQWHGQIDYDEIDDLVERIGTFYNKAVACVELMNHGYTVVAGLKSRQYPMYEARSGEPGWITNKVTKPNAIDSLRSDVRDGSLQIRNIATVAEMRTFIEKGGHYDAASGCHDERVDCAWMASAMMRLLPRRGVSPGQKRRRPIGFGNWLNRSRPDEGGGYIEVMVA
ncbi:MAG: hypothetical protein WC455_17440 [Dehalococcoidia bacterium]|jgi:hypothetical protein